MSSSAQSVPAAGVHRIDVRCPGQTRGCESRRLLIESQSLRCRVKDANRVDYTADSSPANGGRLAMERIDLTELSQHLRTGCGLIIGPAQSIGPSGIAQIATALQDRFNLTARGASLSMLPETVSGFPEDAIRATLKEVIAATKASPHLRDIAKIHWSAVLSFTLDLHFEERAQEEAQKKLNRKPITVVADASLPLPPKTVPVFKMLGAHTRQDFSASASSYIQHRSDWRTFVPLFAQMVHGRPVVCLGMSDLEAELLDLAGEFAVGRGNAPSTLLLLADDPLSNNRDIENLLSRRTKLRTAQCSLADLIRTLSKAEKTSLSPPLPLTSDDAAPFERLAQFAEMVVIVNDQLLPRAEASDTFLLHDLLFSPTVTKWDPFAYSLDFPRSITAAVREAALTDEEDATVDSIAVTLKGSAASGKTIVLKRVAFDLAKADHLVLWQTPSYLPDPQRQLKLLFREIKSIPRMKGKCVYYFIDDPMSAGTMTAEAVLAAARLAGVKLVTVVGIRHSDFASAADLMKSYSRKREATLTDEMDDDEWASFPDYLVRLKVCATKNEALAACAKAGGRTAHDSLSTLYWSLPETRASISSSIQDEYFRLCDGAGVKKFFLGTESRSVQVLRDAYEMVAVADRYRAPLPVEILVSALDIDFSLWIDNTKETSPAWGIIYPDEVNDDSTYYRTRNSIVTDLIIKTINGGHISTGGEVRVLSQLISACEGASTPVYREFILRLLVPYSKLDGLRYEDGLMLFDRAIESLPFPDKTLKHHKGLLIKNVGNDCMLAEQVLNDALLTPEYPYTDRGEASQHIHTSLAATILDQIENGSISPEEGQAKAFDHLALARSNDFFNANAVHVHGNLAARLIPMMQDSRPTDVMVVASEAASDIDASLMVLRSPVSPIRGAQDQIKMLEGVRDKVFNSISKVQDIEAEAERQWNEYRSQEGFVVAARRRLQQAQATNRGSAYKKAFDYCQLAMSTIVADGKAVGIRMREVILQIQYEWVVTRQMSSGQNSRIDWELLRQLAADVCSDPQRGRNPLYRFVHAVALAHLGRWPEANDIFTKMRNSEMSPGVLWTPRALLLSENGGPKLIQGIVRDGVGRTLLAVSEMSTDLICSRRDDWPRDGEQAHAYIQFSFGGATAIKNLQKDA